MSHPIDRREFLRNTARLGAGLTAWGYHMASAGEARPEKVVVGVMGVNGRGSALAADLAKHPGSTVKYLCDVDSTALAKAVKAITARQGTAPQGVKDFRQILDDPSVDALVIAAPDHWHAPATILACAAGKHVYVEKPCSHNAREGELAVEAARKHNRVVQQGTQRRSWPGVIEGIEKVRSGAIGKVLFARGWYNATRGSIGRGKVVAAPANLDWTLWQGPAPERPFRDNIVHYSWHWFWDWGTGELGNNGVHSLDLCRWGLGVDYPQRVTSAGGRYHFKDDQESPDTNFVTLDFGDKVIHWEGRSCHPQGFENSGFGVTFYGEGGRLVIDYSGYILYDIKGKAAPKVSTNQPDEPHLTNFLECIRSGKRPNADIEEAHKSTLLCHLGNIAWRTGRTLNCDPKTGRILDDKEAQGLWTREYRKGWEPKV